MASNPPATRHPPKGPRPLPGGAATRSYNVASVWETSAALTEDQLKLVDSISAVCTIRPIPAHVVDDERTTSSAPADGSSTADNGKPADAYVGTLDDAVLHHVNQFNRWHTELEAACALEQEEKYKRYADLLNSHLTTCETILAKVDRTVELFDTLLAQHRDVSAKSRALHSSCEQLVREKEALQEFADAIRTKLTFFDEFEQVSAQFQKAQLSLDNDQYLSLMKKLDDGVAYVASHPQYADAGAYMTKFRQLQSKALAAVRNKVAGVLKQAVAQVQVAVAEACAKQAGSGGGSTGSTGGGSKGSTTAQQSALVLPDGLEVPLLYVRFRAAADASLKGLLHEVQARSARPEYLRLLQECHSLYCNARQTLVAPLLAQRLTVDLAGLPSLPAMTRVGCEHLLRVCDAEWQLFEQFFPGSRSPAAALAPLTEPLSMLLYDVLRPQIVVLQDLDQLCELVDVIKHEVLDDQRPRRGKGSDALQSMLDRTMADTQGRIIFRCQAFIKESVSSYTPTSADTDYPALLESALQQAALTAGGPGGGQGGEGEGIQGEGDTLQQQQVGPPDPYAVLYPPLRDTLVCLSKLYRAVDARTFGGLAQEAVAACTVSIQQASRLVARKSGPLDAQLFMVRHLLLLREQIAPFDVDFQTTDIDLDFSHMREHMRRIMAGESSLFALGAHNAVVKMLGAAGPRVLTYQVDSKAELEKQLKSVCEAFIMGVTKIAVEPLLSFITKVTAVRVASGATAAGGKVQPLREQAFASLAKVQDMVAKVNDALTGPLPAAIGKMRLYLANPSTHVILFKPVKSNIAEAHGQVAALLASEYTAEEVAAVPLKTPQELAAVLDAMC